MSTEKSFQSIKGLIVDIDGTLILHGKPLAGAVKAVNALRNQGIKLRFATNTTGHSPSQLAEMLISMGFDLEQHEIMTSVTACADYLKNHFSDQSGYFAVPENTANILTNLGVQVLNDNDDADYVVIGDMEQAFDYALLNKLFNYVYRGAQIIAFHRNPFFFRDEMVWLDSGAFTEVFESIANHRAIITGKPSPALFESAVNSMELLPEQVCVVGDDVQSDIQGAISSGLHSVLVQTGKFKPAHLAQSYPQADMHFESIAQLPVLFSNQAVSME